MERSAALQWLFGAILLEFLFTFHTWTHDAHLTADAVRNNAYLCPPFFQGCGRWYLLSTLPEGYSKTTVFMVLFGLVFLSAGLAAKGRWTSAHLASLPLFAWKVLGLTLVLGYHYNYHQMHLLFAAVLLFVPHKLFFMRLACASIYFLSAAVKFDSGWVLGTYFSSLARGLPLFPDELVPFMTNGVIALEIFGGWMLLCSSRLFSLTALILLAAFHLYSGILVLYDYPMMTLPILLILFGFFPHERGTSADAPVPLDRRAIAGWLVIASLFGKQFAPRLIGPDTNLTLEGNHYRFYMFESNHQCISQTAFHWTDGRVTRERSESVRSMNRCDPYTYWFKLARRCEARGPTLERVEWTFDHSINGGPFYRIVATANACALEYSAFRRNAWIRTPSEGAMIVGYPVKNFVAYGEPHRRAPRSPERLAADGKPYLELKGLEGNPPAAERSRSQRLIEPFAGAIVRFWEALWVLTLIFVLVRPWIGPDVQIRNARSARESTWRAVFGKAAFLALAALLLASRAGAANAPERLSANDLQAIAELVVSESEGKPSEPTFSFVFSRRRGPVYVARLSTGVVVSEAWEDGADWRQALRLALRRADSGARTADHVEICLAHSFRPVELSTSSLAPVEIYRGVLGIELQKEGYRAAFAPTRMIADNWGFYDAARRVKGASGASARVFDAYQVLVDVRARSAVQLYRGHSIETPKPLRPSDVRQIAAGAAAYLKQAIRPDGTFVYLYQPGTDTESEQGLIMVRPMLGLWALGQIARRERDPRTQARFERVLDRYLTVSYRFRGDLSLLPEPDGASAIGPLAILGLAILDGGQAERRAEVLRQIRRTIESAQKSDGSLRSFVDTAGQKKLPDERNYYPGEALLFLSRLYDRAPEETLRERILLAFRYYRAWHLDPKHRRPAFVPWHTRAYATLWKRTNDAELKDFIFEMNDWLLAMQQWDDAQTEDFRGQFWNPAIPKFGRYPHVSSTGVYLESIAEALEVARAAGDREREKRYRVALVRGLHSVRMHQFRGPLDCWYMREPWRALGGLRSNMFNSAIRIDSVGENLMAVWKAQSLLRPEDFSEASMARAR